MPNVHAFSVHKIVQDGFVQCALRSSKWNWYQGQSTKFIGFPGHFLHIDGFVP